jgi:hypothetical protein
MKMELIQSNWGQRYRRWMITLNIKRMKLNWASCNQTSSMTNQNQMMNSKAKNSPLKSKGQSEKERSPTLLKSTFLVKVSLF